MYLSAYLAISVSINDVGFRVFSSRDHCHMTVRPCLKRIADGERNVANIKVLLIGRVP